MLKIVTVEHMRQIEAAADASGLAYATMMEQAGRATAQRALAMLAGLDNGHVTILVGKGNNGGDGLVAARVIAQESSLLVRCYLLAKRDDDPLLAAARDAGAAIANAEDDQGDHVLRQMIASAHLIIDALFGIGLRLPLRGDSVKHLQTVRNIIDQTRAQRPTNQIIDPANPAIANYDRPHPWVLAVDCPSGLDCNTGEIDPHAIAADETITFIAVKPGLLTFPGASAVGQLTVATIGVPDTLAELKAQTTLLADADYAHQWLPARPVNSHKGTYGKALIIGGSSNYRGATGLSARAAYRVGAGLVTVSAPDSVVNSLAGQMLEATWLPHSEQAAADQIHIALRQYDALLMGPGWGRARTARDLLKHILGEQSDALPPLVIDADGLNMLAEADDWWQTLPPNTLITPHPGEMARLTGLSTREVQANRWEIAAEKAAAWNVMLVFKGAHTLIASPQGQIAALPFKTDALAKAGTGDVLAGVLVGLLAQGLDPWDAGVVGSYLHGLAGVLAAARLGTTRSVLAGDVAEALPAAITRVEQRSLVEA